MNPAIDKLIRKWDDPILKQICVPVSPGEPIPYLDQMIAICRRAPGVGLAAPQIGINKRVIVTYVPERPGLKPVPRVFINPEIVDVSEQTDSYNEGCLSYPGVFKEIVRPVAINLKYLGSTRRECEGGYTGFIARVIQHEVDHLWGICKVGDPS